ncbi:ribonuclease HI [Chroococcidiopsis thermalis]|jgi:ribonuclease HI|uniref:Ribonuclease H n=1 Tax=Chroococcidiopsis thermalis (strain PCC 7203) TaxID=251229 RepID=K9TU03_CHRTP|nr:ribonuclease HI [Chroococcidiopsis thermalis]AFY86045.1 Ribonuclease H [Chroococcidiopsis thermalis PCC 7203]
MPISANIQSIYTDGACTGNPGPGGWAAVVYFTDGSLHEIGGSAAQTTNNRMEMQAAIAALQLIAESSHLSAVTIHTDSEYLINGVTKWVKGWKKKGWKTAQGKPVLNQDLWETLDRLNHPSIEWRHVRGHAGIIGNERCDAIARAFASGKPPHLQQQSASNSKATDAPNFLAPVSEVADFSSNDLIIDKSNTNSHLASNTSMIDSSTPSSISNEELPREVRVAQLRNLLETLRSADEIATKGYLITSSELADLMDVHASAVTSRGEEWRWRNWIVSRVRREGNQILWELERADAINPDDNSDHATE